MDKNQSIIDYILTCPKVSTSHLFFNFINAKDDNKQLIVQSNDKTLDDRFIDGSELKRFTFTLMDYKTITYNPIVTQPGYSNENVEDLFDTQAIIEWITQQNKLNNFPNFGNNCIIDSIEALTENPDIRGVDTSINPPLVKYGITIRVIYLDKTNMVWNK